MLLAATKKRIMKEYNHPRSFLIVGSVVALILLVFGSLTMINELKKVFG
jgi:Mn2+/Fe2+ NRAMP family transporter